jgi:hypothetical protein
MGNAGSNALPWRLRGLLKEVEVERLAFVATVILAGATLWFAPRLPMTDLPQHAGQVALLHDLVLGTSKWQPLLYVNYFTPYLVGYGLALLLSFVLPVSAALKLLLALAYYGFVAACVALRGRLHGDRRLDWLFIPGFFGFAYAWGFYTFLIAAPLGLLFILLAHRYADRPTPALAVVLLLADLALFFSHGLVFLLANGIGGMFLLLRCRRVAHLLPALLPYVAVGLWCLVYALVGLRAEAGRPGELFDITWGWDLTRLDFLIFSMGWPTTGGFDANWALVALLLLMLGAPLVLGGLFNRRDSTVFVPFLAVLLVWAFVPDAAMSTWFLYQRFALFLLPFYALMFQAPADPAPLGVMRRLWLPLLCWPSSPCTPNACGPSRRKVLPSTRCLRRPSRGIARSAWCSTRAARRSAAAPSTRIFRCGIRRRRRASSPSISPSICRRSCATGSTARRRRSGTRPRPRPGGSPRTSTGRAIRLRSTATSSSAVRHLCRRRISPPADASPSC